MKEKLLDIIRQHPKHYRVIMSKDQDILDWISSNSLVDGDKTFAERLYSAIYNTNLVCINGNFTRVTRFNSGPVFCGHQSKCKCSAVSTSNNVSRTKGTCSAEKTAQSNGTRARTNLSKYGYAYNSQRPEVRDKLTKSKLNEAVYELLSSYTWLNHQYNELGKSASEIADEIGCYYGTVVAYCRMHGFEIKQVYNSSLVEKQIYEFLQEVGVETKRSVTGMIGGRKEIDLVIDTHRLGIEVNGLYWHSVTSSDRDSRNKHLSKTEEMNSIGYHLLHVTDYEWITKQSIIKSIIRSKINKTNRIYARNCVVRDVRNSEASKFTNETHLAGHCNAKNYYGLYYNGELVQLVSLKTPRFSREYDLEIIRMSTKLDTTVVGGLSKLLTYMRRDHAGKRIISYCDRSKYSGMGYEAAGFRFIRFTEPGFYWTNGTTYIPRSQATRAAMVRWLPSYDEKLSQDENMYAARYRKYWDCGNVVFEIRL